MGKRTAAFLPSMLLLASLAPRPAAGQDPVRDMAARLALAASREGLAAVAVLPFAVPRGWDPGLGAQFAERLTTQLVQQARVRVVERSLLSRLMQEQKLSMTGLLSGRTAGVSGVLPVDAVVTGFVIEDRGFLEAHGRLIEVSGGRILAAARERIGKADLYARSPSRPAAPVPEPDAPAPDLRDAPADAACEDAGRRLAEMESSIMDLKARYWASRIRSRGFAFSRLVSNPGSEILDPATRRGFYARLRRHVEAGAPAPSAVEVEGLRQQMRRIARFAGECRLESGELERALRQIGD